LSTDCEFWSGLDDQDVAFNCGAILREALQYEEICKVTSFLGNHLAWFYHCGCARVAHFCWCALISSQIVLLGPRFVEFFGFVQCPQVGCFFSIINSLPVLLLSITFIVPSF
jgi:hypothetical protein